MKRYELRRPNIARPGHLANWLVRLTAIVGTCFSAAAVAGPITFNTALPVSRGEFLFQETLMYRSMYDGTVMPDMRAEARVGVSVLAYGVTGKLTLFGMIPYMDKTLDMTTPMGAVQRTNHGLGDSTFSPAIRSGRTTTPGRASGSRRSWAWWRRPVAIPIAIPSVSSRKCSNRDPVRGGHWAAWWRRTRRSTTSSTPR